MTPGLVALSDIKLVTCCAPIRPTQASAAVGLAGASYRGARPCHHQRDRVWPKPATLWAFLVSPKGLTCSSEVRDTACAHIGQQTGNLYCI